MFRNEGDVIVISVESRKGGVGKTTAALNIARLCLEDYEVLFLDLDISGTESAFLDKSPVWDNYVNIVRTEKKTPTNLVDLFENYMNGNSLPSIQLEYVKTRDNDKPAILTIATGKINVFNSSIERNNDGIINNYGPQALFDELHSVWFMEMLRELVASCRKAFIADNLYDKDSRKKLVVVVDNAPGYSGLEPAIEEWLTDLGPICGKVLFVSSLDRQDFKACEKGIRDVYKIFQDKWHAASVLYGDNKKSDPSGYLNNRRQIQFFHRLNDSIPNRSTESITETNNNRANEQIEILKSKSDSSTQATNETLCAYLAISDDDDIGCTRCGLCFYRRYSTKSVVYKPNMYIAIIQNKVLEEVISGQFLWPIRSVVEGDNIFSKDGKLFGECPELESIFLDNPKARMIPFDSMYFMLFYVRSLKKQETTQLLDSKGRTTLYQPSEYIISIFDKLVRIELRYKTLAKAVFTEKKKNSIVDLIERRISIILNRDVLLFEALAECKNRGANIVTEFWSNDFWLQESYIPFTASIICLMKPWLKKDYIVSALPRNKPITMKVNTTNIKDIETCAENALNSVLNRDINLDTAKDIVKDIAIDIHIAKDIENDAQIDKDMNNADIHISDIILAYKDITLLLTNLVFDLLDNMKEKFTEITPKKWLLLSKDDKTLGIIAEKYYFSTLTSVDSNFMRFSLKQKDMIERLHDLLSEFCRTRAAIAGMNDDFYLLIDCFRILVNRRKFGSLEIGGLKDVVQRSILKRELTRREVSYMLKNSGLLEYRYLIGEPAGESDIMTAAMELKEMKTFSDCLRPILRNKWKL